MFSRLAKLQYYTLQITEQISARSYHMKILYVSPYFYPAMSYGGPIRSGRGLCRALAEAGCEVQVLTTGRGNGRGRGLENGGALELDGFRVIYSPKSCGDSVSLGLLRALPGLVRWADVVHLSPVYSFPTIPTLLACRRWNKALVWSPRGSLQRWTESSRPVLKKLWECGCRILIRREKLVLHVTSEAEAEQSSTRFPGVRVAVIPNGVDLPQNAHHIRGTGPLRVLYLGRLHPIKGIESLLESGTILNKLAFGWHLRIAGSGSPSYVETLRSKVQQAGLSAQVEFLGEVSESAKSALFANTDVMVLPSHVENFGIVVAEALAHEVPVIASRGTPWSALETYGCGVWVENSPEGLAHALRSMRTMPLHSMGRRGREWMRREFSWGSISREMLMLYQQCAGVFPSQSLALRSIS